MTNSIFQEPWWLDAVAPGQWGEATVKRNGKIVARLPYVKKKRFGLTFLIMPRLTANLGPWIQSFNGKYVKKLSAQRKLVTELIENLPPFDYFRQSFHYSITDWLPFFNHGFQQTTKYSYVIEDLTDLDKIWQAMEDKTRNDIRKAMKVGIKVVESDDIDSFLEVHKLTFARQCLPMPYPDSFVRRLDLACKQKQARKILLAYDNQGRIHAGVYLVYDENSTYYLMGGGDPKFRNSNANTLALWEAIKFATSTSKVFDFEGSMVESIERFFRGFGGIQKPMFQIYKATPLILHMGDSLWRWLKVRRNTNVARKMIRLTSFLHKE